MSNFALKPPPSQSSLFNQFNNITQTHDHKVRESVGRCKCYDLEEFQSMKIQSSLLSLLQLNLQQEEPYCTLQSI